MFIMKKIIILLLILLAVINITSCSSDNIRDTLDDALLGNQTNTDNEQIPDALRSAYSYGLREGVFLDSYLSTDVIVYGGEKIVFPFYYQNDRETYLETGLMMFINGIQQPFSVIQKDGETISGIDMYSLELNGNEYCEFDIEFEPLTGKIGETSEIFFHSLLFPKFGPTNDAFEGYLNYHKSVIMGALNIKFESQPYISKNFIENDYSEFEINMEIKSRFSMQLENDPDFFNATTIFEISTDEDFQATTERLAGEGCVTIHMRAFGGERTTYRTSLYVNHKRIKINGADYIDHIVQNDKGSQFSFVVDLGEADRYSTFYAISTPISASLNEMWPNKINSHLLVNENVSRPNNEKPVPGLVA